MQKNFLGTGIKKNFTGSVALNVDTDLENWEEDWGAAGWDDDDDDDDKFILKVESELQKFKANMEAEKDLNK
ncbi:hypothetical protein PFDG_04943 [Plasmodium falciparum Dd2]|uniref:Uncharacterized protein n=1 Tax=Plasmodium falciparum (isolate Dd2) TaxID=57267 RepID=A0A0L7M951_PLAF4|nr:hypothetical protein PFDG_04943 [Plasmodium falciparum Dd2]